MNDNNRKEFSMKTKYLLLPLMLCALFSSCKSTQKTQVKTIELEGNPTTGYEWIYKIENPDVMDFSVKETYLGSEGQCGAPSRFVYTVIPRKAGTTGVTFEYKRSWENKPAARRKFYSITVDKNKTVTIEYFKYSED